MTAKTAKWAAVILLPAVILLNSPPLGVSTEAWHLFAIFAATITCVILQVLPMGAATLIGLALTVATKALTFEAAFAGFRNEIVWLILTAFFIAHGFISTGLGRRLAYAFIARFGSSSLGLGYGIAFAEVALALCIPSVTARSGGVIYPIVAALSEGFASKPFHASSRKLGAYLIQVAFQGSVVCSAMFLTAMAANPLIAKLAMELGIELTFGTWALSAIVPGMASVLVLPWMLYRIYPPEIKHTPHAVHMANQKRHEMGPMSKKERLMGVGFLALLVLWIFGPKLGVPSAAVAALLGLAYFLLAGVLKWEDLLKQSAAFETFIWFGALIGMASGLNDLGLARWFGDYAAQALSSLPWGYAVAILFLIYFYSHYFFASSTAHVAALFLPFVLVAIKLGAPALPTTLAFAFGSSLFGGLTHYGLGSAPILFGAGFVPLKDWWRIGLIMSWVYIVIWCGLGLGWWYVIGL